MDNRFIFLGGDRRIIYAAEIISRRHETAAVGLGGFVAPQGRYGCIVLPLPFSREEGFINAPLSDKALPLSLIAEYAAENATVFSGGTSPQLEALCVQHGLRLVDYYASEPLILLNAALTAEAAAALLIQNTEYSLNGAEVVIVGGGRIAMAAARLLRGFGAAVTICARSELQRTAARAEFHKAEDIIELRQLCRSADIVINTAPAYIFGEGEISAMKNGAVFMELAGEKYSRGAKNAAINYINAAGLPGKYSPATAGEAIARAVLSAH